MYISINITTTYNICFRLVSDNFLLIFVKLLIDDFLLGLLYKVPLYMVSLEMAPSGIEATSISESSVVLVLVCLRIDAEVTKRVLHFTWNKDNI